MRDKAIVAVAFVFMTGALAQAGDERIFFCNYDVVLAIDDSVGQINSRARVRDGHTVPIEFQDYKVDVQVAGTEDDGVEFTITLFERSGDYWYEINPEPLEFAGTLGIPVQYQWGDGRVSLDVAISVSEQRRLE